MGWGNLFWTGFLGDLLYIIYTFLLIFRLLTLLSPSFVSIRAGGINGTNEGVDNNRGRLAFWRSLRPRGAPIKSSTINAIENIRVYVEYSHCQFRIYGLNVSLWYLTELQILAEVLFVH